MRMRFSISWTNSNSSQATGGHSYVEGWDKVWHQLDSLKLQAGSMCLELIDAPEMGPYSMGLIADNSHYLVTLLEATENDTDMRSFSNPVVVVEMVGMLGDFWDSRHLTSDFELIRNLFKAFFETGDVSRELRY